MNEQAQQIIGYILKEVVRRPGVVDPMFEHDQVGRELIEVAAVAAASHVGLDAGLEPVVEALALLG